MQAILSIYSRLEYLEVLSIYHAKRLGKIQQNEYVINRDLFELTKSKKKGMFKS